MKLGGKCIRPEVITFSWAENGIRWFKTTEISAPPPPHTHTQKGGKYTVVSPNVTIIKRIFYYLHNLTYPSIPSSKLTHEN